MKRIVFLLIAIALFTGIYVQESASAETVTVILSAMTQTYNGKPLKPTVTVKRSDGSVITPTPTITWTSAPKTAVGKYWVTAAVNTTSYTGSASGYFIISRPTGPVWEEVLEVQRVMTIIGYFLKCQIPPSSPSLPARR